MPRSDVFITILAIASLSLILLMRSSGSLSWYELLGSMYPYQLRGLAKYLNEIAKLDRDLWRLSHGRRGLWRRWRNRLPLLRVLQVHLASEPIHKARVQELTRIAGLLTQATLVALLYSCIRPIAQLTCDRATLVALRLYAELADQVYISIMDSDSTDCSLRLRSLL